jgi:hypothetical protein
MIGNKAGWMKKLAKIDDGQETQDPDEKPLTFSFGATPEDVIKKRVNIETPEGYSMQIKNQDEWKIISDVVNQGIDSHLEGFTRSKFDNKTGKCLIHPEEMTTFLRRLYEFDGSDIAINLRSGILATLGIEEI